MRHTVSKTIIEIGIMILPSIMIIIWAAGFTSCNIKKLECKAEVYQEGIKIDTVEYKIINSCRPLLTSSELYYKVIKSKCIENCDN